MPDVVICEPLRTPVGRYGGSLASVSAADLGVTVLQALVERTGIDPEEIDDVILGHCSPNGEAPAIGRVVALDAGLPVRVPGIQVDRRCGSGLQAVVDAVLQVHSGASTVVVAGGTESMSNAAFYTTDIRRGSSGSFTMHDVLPRARSTAGGRSHYIEGGMLETAENLRREYAIPRQAQDELALLSHRRAATAQQDGTFAQEIVPVQVRTGRRESQVDVDEHPRADITAESLAALKPIRLRIDPEATVTAGNASGQNDGAALCLVTTREYAERRGLRPLVRLVSWAVTGVEPERMGIGPVPATAAALGRAGLSLAQVDLIELNEAFAAQVLAVIQEWGFGPADLERTNVHGSGISLGHPVGATGARVLTTLAREMHRRQARYGLETMCIGGGQGMAAVFERVEG
ncbi:MAG: acetyl-CoA C-acetyltransferase [Dermatophilaceae bacterium]